MGNFAATEVINLVLNYFVNDKTRANSGLHLLIWGFDPMLAIKLNHYSIFLKNVFPRHWAIEPL